MLVGRIDDLVGHPPRAGGADEAPRAYAGSVQLINGTADGFCDVAWLVNVPGEATRIAALADGKHQNLCMRLPGKPCRGRDQGLRLRNRLDGQQDGPGRRINRGGPHTNNVSRRASTAHKRLEPQREYVDAVLTRSDLG